MADSKQKSSKGASAEAEAPDEHEHAPSDEHEKHEHVEKHEHAEKPAAHETSEHAAHVGGHAHGHKPNIKEYLVIFVVLAVLTALEVALAQVPGVSRKLIGLGLVGLALTKAAIVGLYYMHLKHETRVLKLTVALPMAAPAIYAVVLISEAAWRLTRF